SFYPILTDVFRATVRTIHVLAPYVHTLLCNANFYIQITIAFLPLLQSVMPTACAYASRNSLFPF
ncbi:hypothetical protein, partial [Nostoc sp.]|uniref:hypothetical protein n=1 Tax=Nostoc sp. TaxID=1180 RepID=UPI002FFB1FE2